MKDYNRDEVEFLLRSLGMRLEECQHWAGILCKWDSFNYMPDIEVRHYMELFWHLLNHPVERVWARHSYLSCHYMWKELTKIWAFRKSLPPSKRWAWKRPA